VVEMLRRTSMHFVHCILPQHNAGLCDLKTTLLADGKTSARDDVMLNVPLVRAQIRGAQIVDAVRLHRQGMETDWLVGWKIYLAIQARLVQAGKYRGQTELN